jgi:DeoR/GlpR family transcriptional regulator of sugar metabolism
LAAARIERIRRFLKERAGARVAELSRELGVSEATIRRDLADMDARGQVRRVHGGAVAVEGRLDEPVFDDKAAVAATEKHRIAEEALRFVKPSDSIFLDGGSTVLAFARLLTEMSELTVVTNSLRVAGTLSSAGPRLILLGGELRRRSQTFVGTLTEPVMERLRVDTAFMGTIGLTEADGLTTTDPREAFTKSLVMRHAGRTILLADSGKLDTVSFVRFAQPEDVDVWITDSRAPKARMDGLRKRGVEVVQVKGRARGRDGE